LTPGPVAETMSRGRVRNAKKPARREKTDPSGPWPDRSAWAWPGMTVRDELDYLVWIAETAEAVGFHGPDSRARWREAVQAAYDALVDPMVHEHGDPLPPDVPPAQRPGTWPDVPAARIQGMTVRHQLTVIRTIAGLSRGHAGAHHQPAEGERWAERVQRAFDAMHHGPDRPMPDSAKTKSAAEVARAAATKAGNGRAGASKTGARAAGARGGDSKPAIGKGAREARPSKGAAEGARAKTSPKAASARAASARASGKRAAPRPPARAPSKAKKRR
jgi:hypothetical protein